MKVLGSASDALAVPIARTRSRKGAGAFSQCNEEKRGSDSQDCAELKRITEGLRVLRSTAGSIWRDAGIDGVSPGPFRRSLLTAPGGQIRDILGNRSNATRMLVATWHARGLYGEGCFRWEGFLMCTAVVVSVIGRDWLRTGGDLVE